MNKESLKRAIKLDGVLSVLFGQYEFAVRTLKKAVKENKEKQFIGIQFFDNRPPPYKLDKPHNYLWQINPFESL